MIKREGSLFDTETKTIGHGVNCVGVMGAGIAKPIKEMFPNNYANYKAACQGGFLVPGETLVCVEYGLTLFNMATQRKPGRDARYNWVFSATLDAAQTAVTLGLDTIAIPMIGCGIGGLKWSKVEKILDTVEFIVPNFEWEVWKL